MKNLQCTLTQTGLNTRSLHGHACERGRREGGGRGGGRGGGVRERKNDGEKKREKDVSSCGCFRRERKREEKRNIDNRIEKEIKRDI